MSARILVPAGGTEAFKGAARCLLTCLNPHPQVGPFRSFQTSHDRVSLCKRSFLASASAAEEVTSDAPLPLSNGPGTHSPEAGGRNGDSHLADVEAGPGPGSLAASGAQQAALPPGLYVIPTPIGNLQDLTLRAADTLRRVNLLLAEDTRHTRKLLNYLGIRQVELLSCHEHNEKLRLSRVMQRLQLGEPVGLVSDAGMPGISDPGHELIVAAVEAGVRVVVLPGPCAFVTALVGSGLRTDTFHFVGFLPPKSGARRKALERLASQSSTLVLYTPPHGLVAVLRDCCEVLGPGRRCCVAREISKLHEEYFRSSLEDAVREFSEAREPRGEICLLIEGCDAQDGGSASRGVGSTGSHSGTGSGTREAAEQVLRELLESGVPLSAAVKEVVANLGANKKATYALALRISESLKAGKEAAA